MESITLCSFTSKNDFVEKELAFSDIASSFVASEYWGCFQRGWPFIRALVAHLAHDLKVGFDDEEREIIYDNVWPLVRGLL